MKEVTPGMVIERVEMILARNSDESGVALPIWRTGELLSASECQDGARLRLPVGCASLQNRGGCEKAEHDLRGSPM